VIVLAIDQGTSATKALVVGPGNEVLGSAEVPVATLAVGRAETLQEGADIALWALGPMLKEAGRIAARLAAEHFEFPRVILT